MRAHNEKHRNKFAWPYYSGFLRDDSLRRYFGQLLLIYNRSSHSRSVLMFCPLPQFIVTSGPLKILFRRCFDGKRFFDFSLCRVLFFCKYSCYPVNIVCSSVCVICHCREFDVAVPSVHLCSLARRPAVQAVSPIYTLGHSVQSSA